MILEHLDPHDAGNCLPRGPRLLLFFLIIDEVPKGSAYVLSAAVPRGLGWSSMEAPPTSDGRTEERLEYAVMPEICGESTQLDCAFKEGRKMMLLKIREEEIQRARNSAFCQVHWEPSMCCLSSCAF